MSPVVIFALMRVLKRVAWKGWSRYLIQLCRKLSMGGPGHFCSQRLFHVKTADLPRFDRLKTPSSASDHQSRTHFVIGLSKSCLLFVKPTRTFVQDTLVAK